MATNPSSTPVNQRTRKRRAARACEPCRLKKYRCDEEYPCTQCKKQRKTCIYEGADNVRRNRYSSSYVADLERRVQELAALSNCSPLAQTLGNQHRGLEFTAENDRHISRSHAEDLTSGTRNEATMLIDRPILPQVLQSQPTDDCPSDQESIAEANGEIRDLNQHTKSIEFHGNTSSMAFLALAQKQNQTPPEAFGAKTRSATEQPSLVSTLHNPAFSPDSHLASPIAEVLAKEDGYYFRHAGRFIDAYFENLHFIHPILEKEEFLARCEDLWFGRPERQSRSFIALYYSILSLGALVRVWDEKLLDGLNRFQWSRKFFTQARVALGELRSTNDLETIQCLIFMAKICQNELNPHLAYMYLGMAVRASLSAGYHRESNARAKSCNSPDSNNTISKTWWGLYSLEVEMSFSLGRPDSVGIDDYYNRCPPAVDNTEIAIIPCMIPFARITRKVSLAALSKASLREKISTANEIETEMDLWISTLPEMIRPGMNRETQGPKILRDPKWARRQRLVLQIRYCNVKMVLYRPFLAHATQSSHRIPTLLEVTTTKCVNAAKRTIEIMHETFCHHVFFRSWWYNSTYILYAASIILSHITQTISAEKPSFFRLVEMALEVLEAMDECYVASKAAEMIKQALQTAKQQEETSVTVQNQSRLSEQASFQRRESTVEYNINDMLDDQMTYMPVDSIFDFEDTECNFQLDDMQFMFTLC